MRAIEAGLVSTIIPVFNRRELLRQSVESVLKQTYRPIEIIVVDDGSEPGFVEYYQSLEDEIAELTLLRQSNTGPGGARQLGLEHANGEFIQFLDSDDVVLPQKFSAQVNGLKADSAAVAAYGPSYEYRSGGETLVDDDYPALFKLNPIRKTGSELHSMFPLLLLDRIWVTFTPMYRRTALDLIGKWASLVNEEDWEYEARLAGVGGHLRFVDVPTGVRLLHDDHFSFGGAVDPIKLESRVAARESIYKSARNYENLGFEPKISQDYWDVFGRYTFLLARQCAVQGLDIEYRRLLKVSIDAMGRKPLQHRLFSILAALVGSRYAASLSRYLGK